MSIVILLIVSLAFFANLFLGDLRTFVTPDFGQSDIFQLNVPLKFFLSESLKNNQLPLWNPLIGTGFPALAEGQTGVFYLPNLILFKFLPFTLAFNIGLVSIFFTSLVATYLFCRELKINRLISILSSLTFSFSGFFIGHLTHFNLIQTASLFPLILFLTLKLLKNKNIFLWGGLYSLILSQQLFAGFPQIVVITLISSLCLVLFKRKKITFLLFFALLIALGFLIASIQLVPQYEFFRISTRSNLKGQSSTFYSYPFKHLVTFLDPYKLGDPRKGTYPPFYEFDGSVFWENTGYIGLLAILIALLGLLVKIPHKKILFIALLLSFLLMTGKYSPLYLFFSIPPLSLFRVPSRFILPFIFCLTILFGVTLQYVFQKVKLRFLLVVIIAIQLVDLWNFGLNYHSIGKWEDWLSKPQTADYIQTTQNHEGRIITLDTQDIWNEVFTKKGWLDNKPYLYFRNDLNPNINVLFGSEHFGVYPVQVTQRSKYFETLVFSGIVENSETISISTYSAKLLAASQVKFLLSTKQVQVASKLQKPVFETTTQHSFPTYKIYQLNDAKEKIYFADSYKKAETVEELLGLILSKDDNLLKNTVILEKDIELPNKQNSTSSKASINVIFKNNNYYKLEVSNEKDALLVIEQSYYPGWEGSVDGLNSEILPANLNSQALLIPSGKHIVTLNYFPESLKIGAILTLAGMLITFLMMFVPLLRVYRKFPKTLFSFLRF